jgi:hypothetical protein
LLTRIAATVNVVRADEKLTAFLELESAVRGGQRLAASPSMRRHSSLK